MPPFAFTTPPTPGPSVLQCRRVSSRTTIKTSNQVLGVAGREPSKADGGGGGHHVVYSAGRQSSDEDGVAEIPSTVR